MRWQDWQERFVQLMVLELGATEEVLQRDTRDLESDTPGVLQIDMTPA